jgi:hypothetical protein
MREAESSWQHASRKGSRWTLILQDGQDQCNDPRLPPSRDKHLHGGLDADVPVPFSCALSRIGANRIPRHFVASAVDFVFSTEIPRFFSATGHKPMQFAVDSPVT